MKTIDLSKIEEHYTRWILVDSPDDFDWNEVSYDGHGFVTLKDGSRLDVKPDLYKSEREEWNAKNTKGI